MFLVNLLKREIRGLRLKLQAALRDREPPAPKRAIKTTAKEKPNGDILVSRSAVDVPMTPV